MDKFFDIIKKLRPGVQSGKVSREAALRELIQESGVSEEIAETAIKNMTGAQPEVPGGITSLKPDVTFSSTQKKLPDPIDMSVEERTGGMLKEGKDGEYTSTMNQESGAANVDPSIMTLGDENAFKYEMALFRQNRQKKLEPIYKKYGAVSKEEKDFVDDFIGLDSEDRIELLKSDPKYKTSTTKLFIEDTVKNQPGIKQEELMEVVYGSTGEKILKERGLNDYIQYAKKEIEELGGTLNEDLLMRGLKDGFNDPDGFANGGRIGFSGGGRKGILSALADKLNEIAPGSTKIGKTTKAMSEAAKRKRAEEEMFKNFEERNPIKGEEPKLEPNTKIIEREKIDVDIGTIEDFYDDFVQAGGDPSVTLKDLQQGYNLKKAYPFNTPYINKKGKLIGQEATQEMYPKSKKFYIEDEDVLSQRITDIREGKTPKTPEAPDATNAEKLYDEYIYYRDEEKNFTGSFEDFINERRKAGSYTAEMIEPNYKEILNLAPRKSKFTAAEVLLERLKNTLKNEKDPYVQETFPNFIKEIEANPKLAEDPKVQEAFGFRDLPKNQRLVEYDDGTFDFFTRGEKRGMGSVKALADEFGISMEEAAKIKMMEPEDQVLEIERRRRLNKRKLNASGGLNYLMGV
jgi:methionine salvage enolase-phosphatase E1